MILPAAVIVAALIEYLQGFVGREQSVQDVLISAAGAWLGLAAGFQSPQATPRTVVGLVSIAAMGYVLPAPLRAFHDEWRARKEFPLLSSFRSDRELSRWQLSGSVTRVPAAADHDGALILNLEPQREASFHLAHAPRDWSAYRALNLRVSLVGPETTLTCRLNDLAHDLAVPHENSDHFEESFTLHPGWQDVELDLTRAASGLATRRMDLDEINGLTCFVRKVSTRTELLVDDLRLLP